MFILKSNTSRTVVLLLVSIMTLLFANAVQATAPDSTDIPFKPAITDHFAVAGSSTATGPLRVNPANPRYFTDGSGKAIILVGSNYWNLFQDGGRTNPPPAFDFDAFLSFAVEHGYNYMKPHVWEQAWHQSYNDDWYIQPTIYKRTGPGNALDGDPKFDLDQFNPAYFDRLRARVIQAGQAGIYVALPLFDRFSVRNGNTMSDQWLGNPFHASNNINGINGDPTNQNHGLDTETLIIPAVTTYQEAYIRHTIDVLNDLDNVIWEVAIEPDGTYSRNGYNAYGWLDHMLAYVHNYEATKPQQHPVLYSVFYPGGDNDKLFASDAEMIAPNASGGFDHDAPALNGTKVVLIDTDHILWTETDGADWAWRVFTRGAGGFAIMDGGYSNYDDQGGGATYPDAENFRYNLGWIRGYANRINLVAMTPRTNTSTCSTGYCLVADGSEYLVYRPASSSNITVNLSAVSGQLPYEWFNPATGGVVKTGMVTGGASRSFSSPFSGNAVLYIGNGTLTTRTPTPSASPTLTSDPLPSPTVTRTRTSIPSLTVTSNPPPSPTATRTPTSGTIPTSTLTRSATPNPQPTIKMGETNILSENDSGNGGLIVAYQTSLSQTATLQSLSFYVAQASGRLQLGVYSDTNGNPGSLIVSTGLFTPAVGWNTQSVNSTSLPAGNYWLAYKPENSSLAFRMARTGNAKWYTSSFGSMPQTFSSSANGGAYHWSFYASSEHKLSSTQHRHQVQQSPQHQSTHPLRPLQPTHLHRIIQALASSRLLQIPRRHPMQVITTVTRRVPQMLTQTTRRLQSIQIAAQTSIRHVLITARISKPTTTTI